MEFSDFEGPVHETSGKISVSGQMNKFTGIDDHCYGFLLKIGPEHLKHPYDYQALLFSYEVISLRSR